MTAMNDSWLGRVEKFPVALLFVINAILTLIVILQIYYFFDGYVLDYEGKFDQMSSEQIHFYFTEGVRRFVRSMAVWAFVLLSVNLGISIFFSRTKASITKYFKEP